MVARAVASYLNRPIMPVGIAEIESQYVGEMSKNIAKVFSTAQHERAVLFIDEADAWLSRRIESPRTVADHVINSARATLLACLDGPHELVIFTSNLVSNYDPAFVRRLTAFEFTPP